MRWILWDKLELNESIWSESHSSQIEAINFQMHKSINLSRNIQHWKKIKEMSWADCSQIQCVSVHFTNKTFIFNLNAAIGRDHFALTRKNAAKLTSSQSVSLRKIYFAKLAS